MKTVFLCGAAAVALSACSSNSSNSNTTVAPVQPETPLQIFQTMGATSQAVQNRVTSLPGSRFDAVPTGDDAPSATFTGTGEVTMVLSEANDVNFRAIGDATVTVNFATEAVTGGLGNLMGAVGTEAEVNALSNPDSIIPVTGTIALSRGDIFAKRPNRFGVDYSGTVNAGGSDYAVAGRALGQFNGTRADPANGFPIRAVQITDQSDTFATVTDGDAIAVFEGSVGIFGETQ